MSKNEIDVRGSLKKGLRRYRSSINEVAKRAGCSREWVRLVLSGARSGGEDVLLVASEVLKERESQAAKRMNEIRKNLAAAAL